MKKNLSFILILFTLMNCSSLRNNNKYHTFSNDDFTLNYPKGWKEHIKHRQIAFSPKHYLRTDQNYFQNIFTIYTLNRERNKDKTIDMLLKEEKERAIVRTEKTRYVVEVDSVSNMDVVILKMEQTIPTGKEGWSSKEIKHYYNHKGIIYIVSYSVIADQYSEYIDDAMIMFNSFKFND